MKKLLLVSAVAMLDGERRVLIQQRSAHRSMAGLWEFPGGKIEDGETPEQALIRELEEELGVLVRAQDCQPLGFASDALGDRHLLLLLFAVHQWTGVPAALDADALRWATVDELRSLPMPPADLPLIDMLARFTASS